MAPICIRALMATRRHTMQRFGPAERSRERFLGAADQSLVKTRGSPSPPDPKSPVQPSGPEILPDLGLECFGAGQGINLAKRPTTKGLMAKFRVAKHLVANAL